jgi:hypothetical protein
MTILRDAICRVEREDPTGRTDEEDRQKRKTASGTQASLDLLARPYVSRRQCLPLARESQG